MQSMTAVIAATILISLGLARTAEADTGACPAPTASIEVAVDANGDDGLTQRLREAIRAAYAACDSGYTVAEPGGSGRLTVTLLDHVRWKQVGARTRVFYQVGYAVYGQPRGRTSGACWEDRLHDCARAVVKASPFVNLE